MAEIAVRLVVSNLILLLVEEAKTFRGVHRQVDGIICELERIQSFLKDADAKAEREGTNEGAQVWVKQVRERAYQIEDIVDEYMLRVRPHRRQKGFAGFLRNVYRFPKNLIASHQLSSDIQEVRRSLQEIHEGNQRYRSGFTNEGLSVPPNESEPDLPLHALFIDESELVGIESPRDELMSWLLSGEPERAVLTVVGTGGIGKTTLCRKVYDRSIVHFDCHAWISVSQTYKRDRLLRIICKLFQEDRNDGSLPEVDSMEVTILTETLREFLYHKKYIVVLDDVWETDVWDSIQCAFPKNKKGSRVMITSRHNDVASFAKEYEFDHIYRLQLLTQEQSLELFCRRAFRTDCCPPELEEISVNIVKKLEGLPLAIVAIGGVLLRKEKDVSVWQQFHESIGSELESNQRLKRITAILSLSYRDLPYNLKSCLLYLGMFPEDYCINRGRLVRLWVSEGFVQQKEGKTLEEVGDGYLAELIIRSLVQVANVNIAGKVESVRIHDLWREMILLKSRELIFSQVLVEENSTSETTRRLSIQSGGVNVIGTAGHEKIRSILLFNIELLPSTLANSLFANFLLLKVLDFEDAPLNHVPDQVGHLIHLRYLGLKGTRVAALSISIGKLYNLQTLDLSDTSINKLPFKIDRLRNLRNLLSSYGLEIEGDIGSLKELQVLNFVDAGFDRKLLVKLGNLRQLRTLGIQKLREEHWTSLCSVIDNMKHLEILRLRSLQGGKVELQHVSSPPQKLWHIELRGRMEKFPTWISRLQSLVKITLVCLEVTSIAVKELQTLPNLLHLQLKEAYDGEELHFEAGGFQVLKRLDLLQLKELKMMTVEKGSMPHLEEVWLEDFRNIQESPSGIEHLRNLHYLRLCDMPGRLVLRMLPDEGEDYWKVKHIANVEFYHRVADHNAAFICSLDDSIRLKEYYSS